MYIKFVLLLLSVSVSLSVNCLHYIHLQCIREWMSRPTILDTKWRRVVASRLTRFSPEDTTPVFTGQEAGWTPERVWTLWWGRNPALSRIESRSIRLHHRRLNSYTLSKQGPRKYDKVSTVRYPVSEIRKFFVRQDVMSGRLWEGSWRFTHDVVFNLIVTSNAMFSVTWPAVK
jgi:hypothetical protein